MRQTVPISAGSRTDWPAPAETVIRLERTTCLGSCPSYTLEILADGTVNFEGRDYVRVKGKVQSKIDAASLESLVKEFIDIDFFALKDTYETRRMPDGREYTALDLPSTIITLTFAGKHKQVRDYLGTPESLRQLEKKIDTAVNSKRWVNIDSETVREKCRQGWDVNGDEGKGLLWHAAFDGEGDVVRTFIAEGANVRNDADSISLLQDARSKEVFEALISAGADVNAKPVNKRWFWHPPISGPARRGDPDSLKVFIQAGATVDSQDDNGATALMTAAERGVPESVKILLSAGADAGKKDNLGKTALDYARRGEESGWRPELRAEFEEIKKLLAPSQQG